MDPSDMQRIMQELAAAAMMGMGGGGGGGGGGGVGFYPGQGMVHFDNEGAWGLCGVGGEEGRGGRETTAHAHTRTQIHNQSINQPTHQPTN